MTDSFYARKCNETCVEEGKHCYDLTAKGDVVMVVHLKAVPFLYDVAKGIGRQLPLDGTAVRVRVGE